ncbi:MAG: lysylphosphatidylglycerol synthase domain-containing protein [Anaerolineales bacterium]
MWKVHSRKGRTADWSSGAGKDLRLPRLESDRQYGLGNRLVDLPFLVFAFLLSVVNFLLSGGIADFLLHGIFHASHSNLWTLSGLYSIAWVVGFITPGAPAGLGVRETIFLTALRPIYGEGAALGITVTMRVLTAFGDALIFAVGICLRKWVRPAAIT